MPKISLRVGLLLPVTDVLVRSSCVISSSSLFTQLYISEMAHERVRGTLGSCVQLMVVLGIMGVYLAGMLAQL